MLPPTPPGPPFLPAAPGPPLQGDCSHTWRRPLMPSAPDPLSSFNSSTCLGFAIAVELAAAKRARAASAAAFSLRRSLVWVPINPEFTDFALPEAFSVRIAEVKPPSTPNLLKNTAAENGGRIPPQVSALP
eukprot:CAMPEP_0184294172 /NCGR_PEP_ID=MMETSP1049-20130417/5425_1 /TAXON_ID=77928 /ORGANISM="Proteomonas sulcata, Strain CCMP704" /LENGTH=130 /DNA_ID=CAMNT_0026602371 /DNA_START=327 /DNA_END=719 /DNA_ORIENTATION=+